MAYRTYANINAWQAAAILAAGLEDWVDFGVIIALLLLNATVGFVQEYQAGSIVDELKKTLALKATVLRAGNLTEVDAPQVVPGDILQIEEVSIAALAFSKGCSSFLPREPSFLQMVASLPTMPFFKSINLR